MMLLLRILILASFLAVFALPAQANLLLMPGDVIEGHVKEEEDCELCHKRFDKDAQPKLCADCHKDIRKDLKDKTGYHGKMKEEKQCKECHTEHKGRDAKIVIFDEDDFDHKQTDYQLKDKHAESGVECADCHKSGKKYSEAPSICYNCHKKDDDEDGHQGNYGKKCETCHTEKGWEEIEFDHDKETDYKLLYKHKEAKCDTCHTGDLYEDKIEETTCVSCHKKDDDKDGHKGKFGKKCESCHTERGWDVIKFNHDRDTDYKLLHKHKKVKCNECHKKGNLYKAKGEKKLDDTCYSCHKKDDDKDGHQGKYGKKCESCHSERDWDVIKFNHNKDTDYKLRHKHKKVKCSDCHTGDDIYKDKIEDTTCVSCHKKDDDKDGHKGKYGKKCESCHTERDWDNIKFNHDKDTDYKLLHKHKKVKCGDCHKGNLYEEELKTNCFSCHEDDDEHEGQEGKKCETCHDERSWKDARDFDHNRMSKFPLLGGHTIVRCGACHEASTFQDAKTDCWSCHEDDDVHKRKLGTECKECHNVRNWMAWDFDHDQTEFKLDSPHDDVGCYECHRRPMSGKVMTASDCGSCHDSDDVHNGSYGDQCQRCHDGDEWSQIKVGVGE